MQLKASSHQSSNIPLRLKEKELSLRYDPFMCQGKEINLLEQETDQLGEVN